MKKVIWFTALSVIMVLSLLGRDEIKTETVRFEKGKSSAVLEGSIKGYGVTDYQLTARKGQELNVNLKTGHTATYFNVLPKGNPVAIFIGSIKGNRFTGKLPQDGTYTIRVYMMRSAARRNETAKYKISVSITVSGDSTAKKSPFIFEKKLTMQGVGFHVTVAENEFDRTLTIKPSGLKLNNDPVSHSITGRVTGAEAGDINADGSPEIYVFITSSGSGSYGSLIAYSVNKMKSMTEIYLPPLSENKKLSKGYMGHDTFALLENAMGHRFPVYLKGDSNAKPSGGMRQIQYKLAQGEAGWVLKVDKVIKY